MEIKTFEDFYKLQDYGSRNQLKECWDIAQRCAMKAIIPLCPTKLTFDQLSEANRVRQLEVPIFQGCITWTPSDWMLAITGEIGEAANWMKKRKRGDEDASISNILKELADVIIYTDILIQFYHCDTGAVVAEKFDEVSDRVGSTVKLLPERTSS